MVSSKKVTSKLFWTIVSQKNLSCLLNLCLNKNNNGVQYKGD